jgi:hypothetical protein
MSCDRQPSYLSETLKTIPSDFRTELFFQTDKENVVFPDVDKVVVVGRPFKGDPTPHRDSQHNYSEILLNTTDGIIIEDDVQFSKKFSGHLEKIKRNIAKNEIKNYAIALYSCYDWNELYGFGKINRRQPVVYGFGHVEFNLQLAIQHESPLVVEFPVDWFCRTQAMMYDLETARNFGSYLAQNIGKEPYDLALITYIKTVSPSTRLLASTYSLVQHIGENSSGLGQYHRSENFLDIFPW